MGLEWISLFFAFLCRVCICLCFCALFFIIVFAFLLFPLFFVFFFLCFSHLHFFLFQENLVSSAHFKAVTVDRPSAFGYGETAKTPRKRKFCSDPVYTNPVRNFLSDAPCSRLRPNDPSSGLTNDTREDPITDSHRPIATKKFPENNPIRANRANRFARITPLRM